MVAWVGRCRPGVGNRYGCGLPHPGSFGEHGGEVMGCSIEGASAVSGLAARRRGGGLRTRVISGE